MSPTSDDVTDMQLLCVSTGLRHQNRKVMQNREKQYVLDELFFEIDQNLM